MYTIIIPARYGSTRFPGKVLAQLGDRSILAHVYEKTQSTQAKRVIIATDDPRIELAAKTMGAEVCMTSTQHENGTARLAEVIRLLSINPQEIIVNLQGDEPFMPPSCLDQVAQLLIDNSTCVMATLAHTLADPQLAKSPDIVKLVTDKNDHALYFSRAPIPYYRDHLAVADEHYSRHIGVYAYTAEFLTRYPQIPACPLETAEQLEQLRVLWHGEKIKVGWTDQDVGIGIDRPADLIKAQTLTRQ